MLGDDGFQRSSFAQRSGIFGAETIEVRFGARFLEFLFFDRAAELCDFFGHAGGALGDGFKFEGELAALSTSSRSVLLVSSSVL